MEDGGLLSTNFYSRQSFPKHPHLPLQIVQAAVVVDDIVRELTFFFQAHLRVDGFLSFRVGDPISSDNSLRLCFFIASDENHRAKPFMDFRLEEQGDFVDDYRITGIGMFADSLFGQGAHARMNDLFEFLSRLRIVEYDRAKLLPVERLIGL